MKPRTVIVTLELETDAPLKTLKAELRGMLDDTRVIDDRGVLRGAMKVRQVHAQVAQASKPKRRAKK